MDLEKFWCFTILIGWKHLATIDNGEEIGKKTFLILIPDIEERKKYFDQFVKLKYDFINLIDKWGTKNMVDFHHMDDDGFNDCAEHVIGLGQDEYENNLKDPSLFYKRITNFNSNFENSFGNCIFINSDHYFS